MSDTVTVALISSGATMLVSITALLLNYRGFVSLGCRIERVEHRGARFSLVALIANIAYNRDEGN
jgi:hypothetical protein